MPPDELDEELDETEGEDEKILAFQKLIQELSPAALPTDTSTFRVIAYTTRLKYGGTVTVGDQLRKLLPDMVIEVRRAEREGDDRLARVTFAAPDLRVATPVSEARSRIRKALKFLEVEILEN